MNNKRWCTADILYFSRVTNTNAYSSTADMYILFLTFFDLIFCVFDNGEDIIVAIIITILPVCLLSAEFIKKKFFLPNIIFSIIYYLYQYLNTLNAFQIHFLNFMKYQQKTDKPCVMSSIVQWELWFSYIWWRNTIKSSSGYCFTLNLLWI